MAEASDDLPPAERWAVERAEELLQSLKEVVSARLVAGSAGEIEEIHLVTTHEVSPKQTVRNVESALLAQLGVQVDHRKISVAQTRDSEVAAWTPPTREEFRERGLEEMRILYLGHEVERSGGHRIRLSVTIRWGKEEFEGAATGHDLPRSRLGAAAGATAVAIEKALDSSLPREAEEVALSVDGVETVEAFDRSFVLVALQAMQGREVVPLQGAAGLDDNLERAAILATLQAADRWARGRIHQDEHGRQ